MKTATFDQAQVEKYCMSFWVYLVTVGQKYAKLYGKCNNTNNISCTRLWTALIFINELPPGKRGHALKQSHIPVMTLKLQLKILETLCGTVKLNN